jgi:hypothetical protein
VDGLRVPFRQIELSGGEPPFTVYDTAGPPSPTCGSERLFPPFRSLVELIGFLAFLRRYDPDQVQGVARQNRCASQPSLGSPSYVQLLVRLSARAWRRNRRSVACDGIYGRNIKAP